MKSIVKKSLAVTIVVFMLIMTAIPFASAATLLDESKKVSFKVSCDKPGYTFEVYEVAKLKNGNSPSFETAYEPLFDGIADEVKSGKTKDILHKLDSISPALSEMPATAISCGVFDSKDKTKTYSNLEQGIYYVKCTGFPAGVKSVENSVVVLPYFKNNSWVYTINTINLATKVDVSIGDTVDFALYNSTAGSSSIKLTTYTVYDKMSKGLTFDKNSVKVYLADKDRKTLSTIANTNYTVNITSIKDGQDTEFNVALSKNYLAGDAFYESSVKYVLVTYSATLNKHAVVGVEGNPNEDVELKYGNDSHVDSVPGNKVYVYTYGVGVTKLNENGSIGLTACYDITVYATADGYKPSDKTTAKLYWVKADGSLTTDNINAAKMRGVVVAAENGIVTVSGLSDGEKVEFYAIDGKLIGAQKASGSTVSIATSEHVVICKMGGSSIKILVKE